MSSQVVTEITRRLGEPLTAGKGEIKFCCPFCLKKKGKEDTKFKLYLNDKKGLFHCQRCKSGGKLNHLLSKLGISVEPTVRQWADTIRALRAISGIDYTEVYNSNEEIDYPCDTYRLRGGMYSMRYLTGAKDTKMSNGLSCRGLTKKQVKAYKFRVGSGGWEDRLFIPAFGPNGIVFWTARDLSGESEIKYLHAQGRKRRYHVFNLDKAAEYDDIIITEGPFDAIGAGPNAVAIYGSYASDSQIKMMQKVGFRTYYVALDPDMTETIAVDLATKLHARGLHVRMVVLPDGEDPGSIDNFDQYLDEAIDYTFASRMKLRIGTLN